MEVRKNHINKISYIFILQLKIKYKFQSKSLSTFSFSVASNSASTTISVTGFKCTRSGIYMVHCFLGQHKTNCKTAFCSLNGTTKHSIFKPNSPTLIVDLQSRQFANRFCLLCRTTDCSLLYLLSECKILCFSSSLLFLNLRFFK